MKKLKENKGFTLVELIVVIAILGILAAVAVPAYSGYVKKAQDAADLQTLDAIKTAVTVAAAEDGVTVTSLEISKSDFSYSVKMNDTDLSDSTTPKLSEVTAYTGTVSFSSDFNKATWTSSGENALEWQFVEATKK